MLQKEAGQLGNILNDQVRSGPEQLFSVSKSGQDTHALPSGGLPGPHIDSRIPDHQAVLSGDSKLLGCPQDGIGPGFGVYSGLPGGDTAEKTFQIVLGDKFEGAGLSGARDT